MDKKQIKSEIVRILRKCLEREIVIDNDEKSLIDLYGINSIDALEIFLNIENTFDILIPDEDLSSKLFESIDYLCEYIFSKVQLN